MIKNMGGEKWESIKECFMQDLRRNWTSWILMATAFLLMLLVFATIARAEELMASWYSEASLKTDGQWAISGGKTANGQLFSDSKLTAACNTFPLGTKVKVTRTDTKASVVVLVNDRTAKRFTGKRIDLSPKAFDLLADRKQGIIKVEVTKI